MLEQPVLAINDIFPTPITPRPLRKDTQSNKLQAVSHTLNL